MYALYFSPYTSLIPRSSVLCCVRSNTISTQIMIAPYEFNRASYIFFLAFILLGTFFLMNLFTAVVYTKYQESEKAYEKDALEKTEEHLTHAFHLLDTDGSGLLSKDEMLAVVWELRKAHLLPELQVSSEFPDLSSQPGSQVGTWGEVLVCRAEMQTTCSSLL